MELKAQYNLNDLVELVKKDLDLKGFALVGEPNSNNHKDFILTLVVEQLAQLPAPAPVPASEQPKAKYIMSEKRQEVLARARAKYAEKKKAEKLLVKQESKQVQAQEVVAPSTVPFQGRELLMTMSQSN